MTVQCIHCFSQTWSTFTYDSLPTQSRSSSLCQMCPITGCCHLANLMAWS